MDTIRLRDRTLVIADAAMRNALDLATRAARSSAPVLICGESGTGKELIARYIHEKGLKGSGPFLSVNCAAIPEGLIEAELFGYERGAFTGAVVQRVGKFERASGGTFLLDEVSEMPVHLQAKLLRVLQEGEIDRIGAHQSIPVKTRVIATTNRDPLDLVKAKSFRADLFFRLNVLRVDCPALRGRADAIRALAVEFLRQSAYCGERVSKLEFAPAAIDKLIAHHWPGNVRELQNVIERAAVNADGPRILPGMLEFFPLGGTGLEAISCVSSDLSDVEQNHILAILDETQGNRTVAARKLGISVRTLRNKLKEYQGN